MGIGVNDKRGRVATQPGRAGNGRCRTCEAWPMCGAGTGWKAMACVVASSVCRRGVCGPESGGSEMKSEMNVMQRLAE